MGSRMSKGLIAAIVACAAAYHIGLDWKASAVLFAFPILCAFLNVFTQASLAFAIIFAAAAILMPPRYFLHLPNAIEAYSGDAGSAQRGDTAEKSPADSVPALTAANAKEGASAHSEWPVQRVTGLVFALLGILCGAGTLSQIFSGEAWTLPIRRTYSDDTPAVFLIAVGLWASLSVMLLYLGCYRLF